MRNINVSVALIALSCIVLFATNCNSSSKDTEYREDLLSKSLPEQVLMLQQIKPEEAYQYWRIKLEDTINSQKLSDSEKAVIKPVLDYLTPELYEENCSEEISSRFNEITSSLQNTLKNEFGWSDAKIFKYFETIMTEAEYEEYLKRNDAEYLDEE